MNTARKFLSVAFLLAGTTHAQSPSAPIERRDPAVDAAAQWIGHALFLRCFCAENDVSFDAQGHPLKPEKTIDWTLAGFALQKVLRKGPGEVELDGVRVAMRFATDRREFDRKPQALEKMRLLVADDGDAAGIERALRAVFAEGIDRSLQLAMPDYWQHYFDPSLAWPPDALTAQVIYGATAAPGQPPVTPAEEAHKTDVGYTPLASRDRVTGIVKVRLVVDAQGTPRRVAVAQPLGYGLDALAVAAMEKYRFKPATVQGKPVAQAVQVGLDFIVVDIPH